MTGASFALSFMLAGRGGSVSRRDHNPKTRKRAQLAWALKSGGKVKPIPSRSSGERGLGGEGKDSHSRQWRLSMAVFLNRNKRPKAAPIEVAELLSEKPPLPPEFPPPHALREGARGRERQP